MMGSKKLLTLTFHLLFNQPCYTEGIVKFGRKYFRNFLLAKRIEYVSKVFLSWILLFFFSRPSIMHKKKPGEHVNGQTCVCGCSCCIYYWWVVTDSRVQLGFQVYYRVRRVKCMSLSIQSATTKFCKEQRFIAHCFVGCKVPR